jgi:hypothetical protein
MENRKVLIQKMSRGSSSIIIPELHLRVVWEKKNTKRLVPFEALKEALYMPGIEALFRIGHLYPVNKEDRIALGLEEEVEEAKETIVVLTDEQRQYYLTTATIPELKEVLSTLSPVQVDLLVEYAVANELGTVAKSDVIKRFCGKDIMKLTQFKRAKEED